jgi:hypothetical protein
VEEAEGDIDGVLDTAVPVPEPVPVPCSIPIPIPIPMPMPIPVSIPVVEPPKAPDSDSVLRIVNDRVGSKVLPDKNLGEASSSPLSPLWDGVWSPLLGLKVDLEGECKYMFVPDAEDPLGGLRPVGGKTGELPLRDRILILRSLPELPLKLLSLTRLSLSFVLLDFCIC